MAIAALVLGIIALFTFPVFVPAVAALVLAAIAWARLRRPDRAAGGGVLAAVGAVLGTLSILGGIALWVAVAHSGVFNGQLVVYDNLQTGDCINLPSGVLRLYHRFACDHPHQREVSAVVLDQSPSTAPYPGTAALIAEAEGQCGLATQGYLGSGLDQSRYGLTFEYPTARGWANGERRILCMIARRDGSKLTSAVRGAA